MSKKETRIMMGMAITVEIADIVFDSNVFKKTFDYFEYVDEKFSMYKDTSEISLINKNKIPKNEFSNDMKEVFYLSEETKKITNGYFDIETSEGFNPTGLVKGWAIKKVSDILREEGVENFYINAGGDIEAVGKNSEGGNWSVGIRSPFNPEKEIVKVIYLSNKGVATSGSYIRGSHIYNPHQRNEPLDEVLSFTVIGPNAFEADRFATAAFAMGQEGINFIAGLDDFEGYMIDSKGQATMTSGFNEYTKE